MTAKVLHCTIVTAALVIAATAAAESNAQCCGGGATTAFYQPTTVTAFSPVVMQTQPGWYPGFFLDRIRTRLWGAPTTFVAAQPTTFAVARPVYTANFATTSFATTSFAPVSACSTCAPAPQVTMRPVIVSDPCTTCSPCSAGGVIQTSYEQPSGCDSCGTGGYSNSFGTTIVVPNGTVVTPGAQQSSPSNGTSQPTIPPEEPTPTERSQLKPPGDGTETPPAGETNGTSPEDTSAEEANGTNANYFEAPKLFDPKDRTAQRKISPVRTALYEQQVGYRSISVSRQKITAEQAQRDAAGWTSASN